MKILIITQYFYPENFRVNTLCHGLVRKGYDITVLTGYPQYPQGKIYDGYGFNIPYEKDWHGIKIERIKMRPRGKTPVGLLVNCWSFVQEGYKWVDRCTEKYDAVYVFGVSPVTVGLPAVRYKKRFGTPMFFNVQDLWPENVEVILGIHNQLIIGTINKIVDKIYTSSDIILCSSKGFIENIANRGVERDKLVFWPQFCAAPDVTNITKPDIYTDDTFNIVFAGNIGDAQGLDLLIEAALHLKDEKVKWYLVGDGRAKKRLEKLVIESKMEETVIFVGKVSEEEANRYVHFADCAYLSFKDNMLFNMTIPAKLQTYLACGTPILAAAQGESADIIIKAECGIAVVQESDKLVDAVKKIISLTKDQISDMRKNALCYYEQYYTVNRLVDQFAHMLEEINKVLPTSHRE